MSHNAKGPSSKSDQFLTWHAMYCNALQCIQNKPDLKKKPTHSMTNVSQVNMSIAIVQMVKQVQEVNQMIKKYKQIASVGRRYASSNCQGVWCYNYMM